jgi:hypothetical protein
VSKVTFGERARYWFDNTMSKGTASLIGWLAMVSLGLIVVVAGLTLWLAPNEPEGVAHAGEVLWIALMHALTPSKVASDKGSVAYMIVMFAGSLGGLFIVSMLVGLLSNGLKHKVDRLRRGRSRIVESGGARLVRPGVHDRGRAGQGAGQPEGLGHRGPGRT